MNPQTIKTAAPGTIVNDDVVRGLSLRVFPQRSSFYLFYRTKGGVQRRPKIGDLGVITLSQARDIARTMLAEVATGKDPSGERRAEKQMPTLLDAFNRYWRERGEKSKTGYESRRLFVRHVQPRYGNRRIDCLQFSDIDGIHRALEATPYQANRAVALLSRLCSLAERWGWRTAGSNPCRHIERFAELSRKRYATPDELARLGPILERESAAHPREVAFIKLLMFTGARPSEIQNATWSMIDGTVLRLPDGKTGQRDIYLSPQALNVLSNLPRSDGPILGAISPKKFWERVRSEAGCPDLWMRDQRRTFATIAMSSGVSASQVGELLGHKDAQTTKVYAKLMEGAAMRATTSAAGIMAGLMNASATRTHIAPEQEAPAS